MSEHSCIVLLSGGQDSTTCLYWAKIRPYPFDKIYTLHIRYGQRHHIETKAAYKISQLAETEHSLIDIGQFFREIGDSPLVSKSGDISAPHRSSNNLPASFIPVS